MRPEYEAVIYISAIMFALLVPFPQSIPCTRCIPDVLRYFQKRHLFISKKCKTNLLQSSILWLQCPCCSAQVTLWRPHESHLKWSLFHLFIVSKMTTPEVLHLEEQLKVTGCKVCTSRMRDRFEPVFVNTKLYCIVRFQTVFMSRLHSAN